MSKEPVYSLRPATPADVPVMYRLLMDLAKSDGSVSTTTLQDVENLFDHPGLNPPTDSLLAVNPDGELAGAAWVIGAPQTSMVMELWCNIHPDYRGQPQGTALEEWLLTWAEGRGSKRLAGVPATKERQPLLATISWQENTRRHRMLEDHGFVPVRYFHHMQRKFKKALSEVPLPDGLRLTWYTPEIDETLRKAYNEAFQDDWNFRFMDRKTWTREMVARADFAPDLCPVVWDGEEIAAFSLNHVHDSGEQKEGYITHIGTRPAWRRHGIASALLSASLRAFKDAGMDSAALGVDTNNPHQALTLYEKMDFKTVRTLVQYVRYADR